MLDTPLYIRTVKDHLLDLIDFPRTRILLPFVIKIKIKKNSIMFMFSIVHVKLQFLKFKTECVCTCRYLKM